MNQRAAANQAWVRGRISQRGWTQETELLAWAAVKCGFTTWATFQILLANPRLDGLHGPALSKELLRAGAQ